MPSYIKPETIGKREVYYLTLKRQRIISDRSNGSTRETIPKKTTKRDNGLGQESLMYPSKNKGKGPIALIGGFGVWPASGERGQEREELLKTVKEITRGKGEIIPKHDLKGPIAYPKEESNYLETGWDRLELSDNQYGFKERDLSWD